MKFKNSILLLTLPLFSACSPTEMVTSLFNNLGGTWFGVIVGIILLIVAIGVIIDSFSGGVHGDGLARFFGVILLIGGGIALVADGPWSHSNNDSDTSISNTEEHYIFSDNDDLGSSSESSSSSGTSGGGYSQPQPQSWGGGCSQPQYNNQQDYSGSSYENNTSNVESSKYGTYTVEKPCYKCHQSGRYDCPCEHSLTFEIQSDNFHRCPNCGELHRIASYHSCECRDCGGKGYKLETKYGRL